MKLERVFDDIDNAVETFFNSSNKIRQSINKQVESFNTASEGMKTSLKTCKQNLKKVEEKQNVVAQLMNDLHIAVPKTKLEAERLQEELDAQALEVLTGNHTSFKIVCSVKLTALSTSS